MDAAGASGARVIIGLGLDIAEIDRVEAAIARHGAPFLERIYSTSEIAYCESHKNRFERYAARFAAKEAAMKALGTGWRFGVRWRDIEVTREPSGKPTLKLDGVARQFADRDDFGGPGLFDVGGAHQLDPRLIDHPPRWLNPWARNP